MIDMTQGKTVNLILRFASPILFSGIFQQMYSIADTIIVGKFIGEEALAGVGSTTTIIFLLFSIVTGMCSGAGVVIAQCFGNRNYEKTRQAVTSFIYIMAILTILVSVVGNLWMNNFLMLLSVPENVISYSKSYLKILLSFIAANTAYNASGTILQSMGDSHTPLYALIAASILKILLNLLLLLEFNMGVKGVAYATVISQFVSADICIIYIIRNKERFHFSGIEKTPRKDMVKLIFRAGLPTAFQSSLISLGGMSVQSLINSFGAAVMAAYSAASRIDHIAIQFVTSIGTALSVFTGQNIGNNDFKRIKEGLRKTLLLMFGVTIALALTVLLFRRSLMSMFLDPCESRKAIETGMTYLSVVGVAYVISGIMQSYQNLIKGAGDINACMIAGFTELAGRIVFAYLLSGYIGVTGIWIATPLSWACGCIIPVTRYYTGKWRTKKFV